MTKPFTFVKTYKNCCKLDLYYFDLKNKDFKQIFFFFGLELVIFERKEGGLFNNQKVPSSTIFKVESKSPSTESFKIFE